MEVLLFKPMSIWYTEAYEGSPLEPIQLKIGIIYSLCCKLDRFWVYKKMFTIMKGPSLQKLSNPNLASFS